MSISDNRLPVPSPIAQPGVLPFEVWCGKYSYFIDCMMDSLEVRLEAVTRPDWNLKWDYDDMRERLQRYLYARSANRYSSFVLLK